MKAHLMFLILFFTFLLSCNGGKNEQDSVSSGEKDEDGIMNDDGMMDNGMGMMQDQDTGAMMEDDGMGMMQDGMMSKEMREAMMSRDMGPEMMEDMMAIRKLLMQHEKINRRVENLDNGVKTWTTSEDPEIAAAIQKHVRQMHERIKEKKPIRQMDPLFREIFDNAEKIEMQIEYIENGVLVVETSEDPQVVKLIQQHANRAVSEFVERGMQRAMQPTPLPEEYKK